MPGKTAFPKDFSAAPALLGRLGRLCGPLGWLPWLGCGLVLLAAAVAPTRKTNASRAGRLFLKKLGHALSLDHPAVARNQCPSQPLPLGTWLVLVIGKSGDGAGSSSTNLLHHLPHRHVPRERAGHCNHVSNRIVRSVQSKPTTIRPTINLAPSTGNAVHYRNRQKRAIVLTDGVQIERLYTIGYIRPFGTTKGDER